MDKIIIDKSDSITKITMEACASASTYECTIHPDNGGGNSSAYFSMEIEGGQASGKIEMHGEWERRELKDFLETVIRYL